MTVQIWLLILLSVSGEARVLGVFGSKVECEYTAVHTATTEGRMVCADATNTPVKSVGGFK